MVLFSFAMLFYLVFEYSFCFQTPSQKSLFCWRADNVAFSTSVGEMRIPLLRNNSHNSTIFVKVMVWEMRSGGESCNLPTWFGLTEKITSERDRRKLKSRFPEIGPSLT